MYNIMPYYCTMSYVLILVRASMSCIHFNYQFRLENLENELDLERKLREASERKLKYVLPRR